MGRFRKVVRTFQVFLVIIIILPIVIVRSGFVKLFGSFFKNASGKYSQPSFHFGKTDIVNQAKADVVVGSCKASDSCDVSNACGT